MNPGRFFISALKEFDATADRYFVIIIFFIFTVFIKMCMLCFRVMQNAQRELTK